MSFGEATHLKLVERGVTHHALAAEGGLFSKFESRAGGICLGLARVIAVLNPAVDHNTVVYEATKGITINGEVQREGKNG